MSLALRCGLPHFDYLLPYLSARQLNDVLAFHEKHNLAFDRDDTFWSQLLAMTFNVNRPKEEKARRPHEFIPWHDDDDIDIDEFKRRLGF